MADKEFKVRGPDGSVISVMAPENATDAQIEDLAAAQFYKASAGREKVDLGPKPEQIAILQNEYKDAVRRILEARSNNDSRALNLAEGDRAAIARELQRLGPNLIPGADTTAPPQASAAAPSPAQSLATAARSMTSGIDPTRALMDLAAATSGAGGAKAMDKFAGALAPAVGQPGATPVQKWTGAMGYGDRGARTFAESHQLEQGLRRGAKIGGVQPEFRFAKPPIIEPTAPQQIGRAMMTSPKVMGGLGGLGAAESGMQAMQRMQQGDPIGAAIAGAGALGSGASLIPTPATRIGGAAVGAASPLALYLYDKMRQTSPETARQMLTNVDIMGNPMP